MELFLVMTVTSILFSLVFNEITKGELYEGLTRDGDWLAYIATHAAIILVITILGIL